MTHFDHSNLFRFENEVLNCGFNCVAGIDEVGRGPLAGPVVAAAVVFESRESIPTGLNDSKKLSHSDRIRIAADLAALPSVRFAIAQCEADEIDKLNILRATFKAMTCALSQVNAAFALVDGNAVPPNLICPAKPIVKGDSLSASIAAASILAKVHRDKIMIAMEEEFPGYGFAEHKGYGTKSHLDAIGRLGPCRIHRKTFSPIAQILTPPPIQQKLQLDFQDR